MWVLYASRLTSLIFVPALVLERAQELAYTAMFLLLDVALNAHEQGPVVSPDFLKLGEPCEPNIQKSRQVFSLVASALITISECMYEWMYVCMYECMYVCMYVYM